MTTRARKAEADAEAITVTWRQHKFTIAPPAEWQMRFQHYADRDKYTRALEVMLGTEQYEEFVFAEPPATQAEMQALGNAVFSALGLDSGEAQASTVS